MQRSRPGTAAHNAAKRRAVQALKQKRMLDSQVAAASNAVFNLEQVKDVRDQIDFQQQQAAAIKASHSALQTAQGQVDLDEIENLQDDITDTMADVNEVSESLGRTYETEPIDETELMAELEGFENEDFAAVSAAAPQTAPSYLQPAPVVAPYQPPTAYSGQPSAPYTPANPYQQ